jgi:predicted metal-binding membrane protein
MGKARIDPVAAQRNLILGLLMALSVVAWALLIWQGAGHNGGMHLASPTMGIACAAFRRDLDGHDGGHDVPDRRPHDSRVS